MSFTQGMFAKEKNQFSRSEATQKNPNLENELAKLVDWLSQFLVLNNSITDLSQLTQVIDIYKEDFKKQTDVIEALFEKDAKLALSKHPFTTLSRQFQQILSPDGYKKSEQEQYSKLATEYIEACRSLPDIAQSKIEIKEEMPRSIKKSSSICCGCFSQIWSYIYRNTPGTQGQAKSASSQKSHNRV